ncbi:hypothetical protein L914_10238 [Phytophthora nicotianae]|uniref:Uncharacterized protein n=1 Tax=Phytophthora nicotianae TaxID=4792 RepID=W2NA09_PHYNI|nr:hypothetical protein L914_10238 [Phytophthora nicotianae]
MAALSSVSKFRNDVEEQDLSALFSSLAKVVIEHDIAYWSLSKEPRDPKWLDDASAERGDFKASKTRDTSRVQDS